MCKIPVYPLDEKGEVVGQRAEIELPDFDPNKHKLAGKQVTVTIQEWAFNALDKTLRVHIGDGLRGFFGKPLTAIDPGSKYPVIQVMAKRDGATQSSFFWLPRSSCDVRRTQGSIRKSSGSGVSVAASAA